jgi:hypothetical protein
MGASNAKAHRHDHKHRDPHFDESSDGAHDRDAIDALARSVVENEAKKDGDNNGVADKDEARTTPGDSPIEEAVDPSLGKTLKLGGGTHKVKKTSSLWSIANETYGKGTYWHEIKKANKQKVHGSQNVIRTGDELRLPELSVPTLTAFKNFEDQPELLRDLVVRMPDEEYEAFLHNTPRAKLENNGHLVQDIEMIRSTGMTPDEMAEEQKEFIEDEAKKAKKSPGEYIKDLIATKGYGGGTAKDWNKNSAKQKQRWHDRFKKVVKEIKTTAPKDVKQIIKDSEAKGGGFRWNPEETEQLGAFAYTAGDWALHCGTRWVEAAETSSAGVYGNITHEMGGHNYYGEGNGYEVQDAAMGKLSAEDQATANSGGNSMYSAYGYMESEIFAELYEFTYATTGNPSDLPFDVDAKGNDMSKEADKDKDKKKTNAKGPKVGDVKFQLKRIKAAFAPKVAEGLVRGLSRRIDVDARILDKAKELFRADVDTVFGIKL